MGHEVCGVGIRGYVAPLRCESEEVHFATGEACGHFSVFHNYTSASTMDGGSWIAVILPTQQLENSVLSSQAIPCLMLYSTREPKA